MNQYYCNFKTLEPVIFMFIGALVSGLVILNGRDRLEFFISMCLLSTIFILIAFCSISITNYIIRRTSKHKRGSE